MNDIIRLLPDSVANQIAAGEVIQSPAAVIKELVENAIDAEATDIRIIIRDAGRTLIQISDNGKGMSPTDARLAFERHATSKISSPEDLFALRTMGFRGEALPSICAISRVELRTRTEDSEIGTRIVIEGSKVETQEPCVCERGADFQVKNLFFNTPARRRFLGSDSAELTKIMREFERLALAHPGVRLSIDTGSRTIALRGGSLIQRINELWKKNLNMQLIPVEVDLPIVTIKGYISRPEYARRRNPLQFLLVNGRNMIHPKLRGEILRCYENLIARDTQPCFFMTFTVNPAEVDVNISPTKNKVKFQNEKEIQSILSSAVKSALGKNAAVPSIDFSLDPLPAVDPEQVHRNYRPTMDVDPAYNPFAMDSAANSHRGSGGVRTQSPASARSWQKLYDDFINSVPVSHSEPQPELPEMSSTDELPPLCIQCGQKYIASSTPEGLVLIDAYRAEVKILYERFLRESEGQLPSVQRLMFADTIELDAAQRAALSEVEQDIKRMGISLDYVEDSTWQISGLPPAFDGRDARDAVLAVIDAVSDDSEVSAVEGSRCKAALAMARAAAIKGSRRFSSAEMEHIVAELYKLPDPSYTPDGNTIIVSIEGKRLTSLF